MAIMIKDAENFEINLVKDKRTRLEQLEDLSYEICQGWKEGDLNEILEEIKEVIYDEKEVVFQEVIDKLSNNKWYLPWKELKEGVKRKRVVKYENIYKQQVKDGYGISKRNKKIKQ